MSPKGISLLASKVKAKSQLSLPKTVKNLRQFLGVINYYRRFIPAAAEKLLILTELTKGSSANSSKVIWWTEDVKAAFQNIKKEMENLTLLNHSLPRTRTVLSTDASTTAVGGVLQQEIDDELRPIAFFSKGIYPHQQKYSTYDRELLAIFLTIQHFAYFLEGREFIIKTDHRPLLSSFIAREVHGCARFTSCRRAILHLTI